MKIFAVLPVILGFVILSGQTCAQDKIYKRNQEIIECKVKEVGTSEVKYLLPAYPQDVLFSIDTDKILKVVFSNGQETYFQKELDNPENYSDNRKNALKVDFISPLTGNTTFAYERSLKPGRSLEATLGIIGFGIDPWDMNQRGIFFKMGYKFIKSPDYYFNRMRYSHLLKGGYVRPELAFAYYSYDTGGDFYGDPRERRSVFTGALHLVVGKQWIFDNSFLIDFFVGIGYGWSDTGEAEYSFGYIVSPSEVPISTTAGLRVGLLF